MDKYVYMYVAFLWATVAMGPGHSTSEEGRFGTRPLEASIGDKYSDISFGTEVH